MKIFNIKKYIKDKKDRKIIENSGLKDEENFSSERYMTAYPDVNINPILHYIQKGKEEGRYCYKPGDMGIKKEALSSSAPFISIIVTSYNYAEYIGVALDSLLAQTYDNFEVIVVDDGSKDNSVDIIQKYVRENEKIHLFTHPKGGNRGLVESMILGIKQAKGDYVAFCESDDYWHEENLRYKVNLINTYKNVVIASNAIKMVGDENDIRERGWVTEHIKLLLKNGGTPVDLRYNNFNFIPTLSSVMIKTDLLRSLDFNTPVAPWIDFWLYRQILKNNMLYFCDKELTFWRQHNSFNGLQQSSKIANQLDMFIKKSNKLIGL